MNNVEKVKEHQAANSLSGRRQHPRKEYIRDVGVLYRGVYIMEKSTDVSESGFAFTSSREIPVNQKVVLTFQIQGGGLISVTAEVRGHSVLRSGQKRTGCLYSDIRFEYKREIRNFVSAKD